VRRSEGEPPLTQEPLPDTIVGRAADKFIHGSRTSQHLNHDERRRLHHRLLVGSETVLADAIQPAPSTGRAARDDAPLRVRQLHYHRNTAGLGTRRVGSLTAEQVTAFPQPAKRTAIVNQDIFNACTAAVKGAP